MSHSVSKCALKALLMFAFSCCSAVGAQVNPNSPVRLWEERFTPTPALLTSPDLPASPSMIGRSEKICQLTGDTDWETGQPTTTLTQRQFGLGATDLGYPVEFGSKLYLLFGDTRADKYRDYSSDIIKPNDAVGVITTNSPPTRGNCLDLAINSKVGSNQANEVVFPTLKPAYKQGLFNVPTGGVSDVDDTGRELLYAFFWTNHCLIPVRQLQSLRPSEPPLGRPVPDKCPETDEESSIGTSVMAWSDNGAKTFTVVPYAMPRGFVYVTASEDNLAASNTSALTSPKRLGTYVFGVPRYRASVPYLAYAPSGKTGDPRFWRFFVGRVGTQPRWVSYGAWQEGIQGGSGSLSLWKPPGDPEIFEDERCIGEFSVTWNKSLGMWLLLYNCPDSTIHARVARDPWGPWSKPTSILDRQNSFCSLLSPSGGCPGREAETYYCEGDIFNPCVYKQEPGALYAPYVLERFTQTIGSGFRRYTDIYWLVSTWNPYQVTVMHTKLSVVKVTLVPQEDGRPKLDRYQLRQ